MRALLPALLLLFLLSPLVTMRVDPHSYAGGRSRSEIDRVTRNTSAVGQMLGEMRTSLSDIIFLKTERYMDSGVAYVPHLDAEVVTLGHAVEEIDESLAEREVHDEHAGHDHAPGEDCHAGTPTIIRPPELDFRGPIGWMHREIAPWRDPSLDHEHTAGTELLPWYRVMTLADPHSVRGYTMGAWWLRRENLDEAKRFAEEGIANNPDAFQVHLIRGRLTYHGASEIVDERAQTMDWELAWEGEDVQALIMEAQRSYLRATELAIANIPPADAPKNVIDHWVVHDEEDSLAAASLAIGIEIRFGDPERGRAWAREWHRVFGPLSGLNRYF